MADETTSTIFKALADPTRLHIVEFLAKCACGQIKLLDESGAVEGPTAGEVCCHITGADKITSTVSHHLHELENAGLIKLEKRGKTTVCTLVPSALNDLANYLTKLASGKTKLAVVKIMKVLYVCVHNAGRSQMAEAITNHLAKAENLDIQAKSAGTVGGKQLNPQAIEALSEIGISLEGHEPKFLTPEMVSEADQIISMGCGVDAEACPTKFLLTEDWELDDPAGQDISAVRVIRDQIIQRVESMIKAFKETQS